MTVEETMTVDNSHEALAEGITALIIKFELERGMIKNHEITKNHIDDIHMQIEEWLGFELAKKEEMVS